MLATATLCHNLTPWKGTALRVVYAIKVVWTYFDAALFLHPHGPTFHFPRAVMTQLMDDLEALPIGTDSHVHGTSSCHFLPILHVLIAQR